MVFFKDPPPGTSKYHPRCSQSHKLQGHAPPHRHKEIVRGRASPAYSRRTRQRTAPGLEPPNCAGPAQPVGSVTCHYPLSTVSHPGDMRAGGTRSDKTLKRSPPTFFVGWQSKPGKITTTSMPRAVPVAGRRDARGAALSGCPEPPQLPADRHRAGQPVLPANQVQDRHFLVDWRRGVISPHTLPEITSALLAGPCDSQYKKPCGC